MRFGLGFVTGMATGYYLGAKAGRQRYDQMNRAIARVKRSEAYEEATEIAKAKVEEAAEKAKCAVEDGVGKARVGAAAGAMACWSSMESPRWLSSPEPTGVSSETGSWAMRWISRTLAGGIPTLAATSSTVGSRPISWSRRRCMRSTVLMVSTM